MEKMLGAYIVEKDRGLVYYIPEAAPSKMPHHLEKIVTVFRESVLTVFQMTRSCQDILLMSQEPVLEVIILYQIRYLLNRIGKSNIVESKVNEGLKKIETFDVAQYSVGPRTITPTTSMVMSLQMIQ